MANFPAFGFLILSLLSSIYGSAIKPRECGGFLYVGNEAVVEAPFQENCNWKIETDEKHVLAFSLVNGGNFEATQEFFSIHDGVDVLEMKNQIHHEVGLTSGKSINTVYTTSSQVEVRFKKMPSSNLKLKIEKAVDCPFNLGSESSCGRMPQDPNSCYCATFTKRGQANQTAYCSDNKMKLATINDLQEENTIYEYWGTLVNFWTSGVHNKTTGIWTWASTMATLYPGYADWAPFEPNNTLVDGNCLTIKSGWFDDPCANLYNGICELHPEDLILPSTTEPIYTTEEVSPETTETNATI